MPRLTTPTGHPIEYAPARRPLYHQYPRQAEPQGAYLEIDTRDGHAGAVWTWNAEIGNGVPPQVWHGLAIRVPCSPYLTRSQIRAVSRAVAVRIDAVIAGTERYWDGTNHRARQSGSAHDALVEITEVIERAALAGV